jgi:hypothetical protein
MVQRPEEERQPAEQQRADECRVGEPPGHPARPHRAPDRSVQHEQRDDDLGERDAERQPEI